MTSTELVFERSFYIGVVMAAMVYGAQVTMFFQSLVYVALGKRRTREQVFYVAYGGLVLLAVTIVIATKSFEGQQMWIENPDYPGGPSQYLADHAASWVPTLNGAAVVFTDVLVNLLLLYRCFIVWDSAILVALLPALIFLAATGLGIASIIESALLAANIYTGVPAEIGVPYIALTVSFNVLVTLLIALRLLLMHARVRAAFASVPMYRNVAPPPQPYAGIATMLVESASPAAAAGIAFIVSYARRSGVEYTFSQLWAAFMAITPQLIILRVTMGRAWTPKDGSHLTGPIRFAPRTVPDSAWSTRDGTWEMDDSRAQKDGDGIPAEVNTPVELHLRPSPP